MEGEIKENSQLEDAVHQFDSLNFEEHALKKEENMILMEEGDESSMHVLLAKKDEEIQKLNDEITLLKSQLDKFQSVFKGNKDFGISQLKKKTRALGISAEPTKKGVPEKIENYPKSME